jgi:UDP-N-acetylglucosamine 2-epimerase (non-hydrolysing)
MSDVFFDDLELPRPNYYLGAGSGSHAVQTARIMIEFEKVLLSEKPGLILVYGDVNSTVACSLVASKMGIKIAHVESGLRSFDRTRPEEINRVLTDHLSDYLFVTEQSGIDNLNHEGISGDKIFFVGNTMIDSLVSYLPKAALSKVLDTFNIYNSRFILITLHRPSNVDDNDTVSQVIALLNQLAELRKIIFPVHPRTKLTIQRNNLELNPNLILTDPVGYIDFLALMKNAEVVITDSGGIQEETTFLNVPCITLRENTERPCTINIGTNYLVGRNLIDAKKTILKVLNGEIKNGKIPELWDGAAGDRIVNILVNKH